MLSNEQKKWLDHLNDTDKINIIPYDPKTKIIFNVIKKDLLKILGNTRMSHRGSTALKIFGQGEVDLYIPVSEKYFNKYLKKLINSLGQPKSLYTFKRVRFVKYLDNIKVEIFLINKNDNNWKQIIKFEKYLKQNLEALKKYERIKINANGLSTKKYYTAKLTFLNQILKLNSY